MELLRIHLRSECMLWRRMMESTRLVTDPVRRKRSRRKRRRSLPSAGNALARALAAGAVAVAAPLDLHPLRLNEALGTTPIQWIGSM